MVYPRPTLLRLLIFADYLSLLFYPQNSQIQLCTNISSFTVIYTFQQLSESAEMFSLIEKFTITMYDKEGTCVDINEAKWEMFSKINTGIESIPPSKDALLQDA